ncbi:MAG: DUF1049 domain-containing protein [Deltaproteobacteria bacterium]|nr:DUF1049 domain-containing protein [Deltaproteobacteria bacterium]
MRSFKPLLLSLVIIFLVIVVVQNIDVFMDEKSLRLNLLLWSGEGQPVPLSVYFLGFLLAGLLLSYFHGLSERFKTKKTLQNHQETIRKLEEEIKVLKSLPIAEEQTPQKESGSI